MPEEESRFGLKIFFVSLIDALSLITVLIVQGTVLNHYIIFYYGNTKLPYLLFIGDLFPLLLFIVALWTSYHYLKRGNHELNSELVLHMPMKKYKFEGLSTSCLGALPLSYTSWFFFAFILVIKVIVIFRFGHVRDLKETDHFGPQLLKVSLGMSSLIFLLLVEGHNWAKRGTARYSYVTSACAKTGIEIFDSVALLSLLMEGGLRTAGFSDIVITLSAANFFLPVMTLYQLSRSDFAMTRSPLHLSFFHSLVRLLCIDVPFLALRCYLWLAYREKASVFLMKNVFNIVLGLRGLYPDMRELGKQYCIPSSIEIFNSAGPPRPSFEDDEDEQQVPLKKPTTKPA